MPKLQQIAIKIESPYEREELIKKLHSLMIYAPPDEAVRFAFIPSPTQEFSSWIIRFKEGWERKITTVTKDGWVVETYYTAQNGVPKLSKLVISPDAPGVPIGGITARFLRQIKVGFWQTSTAKNGEVTSEGHLLVRE